MTLTNQKYRDALREIECAASTALANQPHDDAECEKHLLSALGKIAGVWIGAASCGDSVNAVVGLYQRREAFRAVAAIAKGKLAKTPPGEDADRLRKIADKMKDEADKTADMMIAASEVR